MTFDLTPVVDVLAENPGAVAAWEIDSADHPRLAVFDVTETPRPIASFAPTQPERRAISERLAAAGYPTGYYAEGTDVVWRNGPDAFEVWDSDVTGLAATADGLFLRDGTQLDRAQVTAVVPFTGTDDVARGVRLRVGDTEHTIAIHFKHLAAYRVDYEDGNGWTWIGWVSFLSRQLATWLDVPLVPR